MAQAIKKYQKKAEYSFTFGAFPTFELLKNKPEAVRGVYVHSRMDSPETFEKFREQTKDAEQPVRFAPSQFRLGKQPAFRGKSFFLQPGPQT